MRVYSVGLKSTFLLTVEGIQLNYDRQTDDIEHSCFCNQTPAAHIKH